MQYQYFVTISSPSVPFLCEDKRFFTFCIDTPESNPPRTIGASPTLQTAPGHASAGPDRTTFSTPLPRFRLLPPMPAAGGADAPDFPARGASVAAAAFVFASAVGDDDGGEPVELPRHPPAAVDEDASRPERPRHYDAVRRAEASAAPHAAAFPSAAALFAAAPVLSVAALERPRSSALEAAVARVVSAAAATDAVAAVPLALAQGAAYLDDPAHLSDAISASSWNSQFTRTETGMTSCPNDLFRHVSTGASLKKR